MKKPILLAFVVNNHKKQIITAFDKEGIFDVYYLCLKKIDKLDLISDGVNESHIFDYPTLFKLYLKDIKSKSTDELISEIKKREVEYNIRSLHKLASYNFARSFVPNTLKRNIVETISFEQYLMSSLIESIKPQAVLGELSRSYYLIAYDICKNRNIVYYHPIEYRSNYYGEPLYTLYNDKGEKENFQLLFEKYKNGDLKASQKAIDFSANYEHNIFNPQKFKSKKLGYYEGGFKRFVKKCLYRKKRIANLTSSFIMDSKYFPERRTFKNPLYSILDRFLFQQVQFNYKKIRTKSYFETNTKCLDKKYVYFPLHFYPEMVSNVWANDFIHYYDQELHLIQLVAKNLPSDYELIVKEHMPMLPYRKNSFYRKVNSLYNVRLFSPSANNFELIRNAEAIISISNTTGFEGFIMQKPVLTFHGAFYSKLPSIKSFTLLPSLPYFNLKIGLTIRPLSVNIYISFIFLFHDIDV